jgi:NADP-dependent 3-hydroxy acid dehydrogenase YdfG
MEFVDQVAVIAGASSGIGRAIAFALADHGANLYLIGRDEKKLPTIVDTVNENQKIIACQADLTCSEDVQRVCEDIKRRFNKVDILIHSLGSIALGSMDSADLADLDLQFTVNVKAPYMFTKGLLPLIISSQGQIVFMNSSSGVQNGRAQLGQYSATKHALKAVADSLREEVNPDGVRVLSVYPGRTATSMQKAIYRMEERDYHPERLLQPDDIASMVIAALSLPGTAEVTDIHIRPMIKNG